jgi:energy-coupling factor transporter ATP-binding protein EcfA2
VITPQKGEIIVETNKGKYFLKDLDLKLWRKKNISYCSHQNLIEEGSTGQRQLKNIRKIFSQKKGSQIWLLDESDNALDKNNQEIFKERISDLIRRNKLVIYIKH